MGKIKVLYAIQGTGNGHVSRARILIPYLAELFDLDVLLSGSACQVDLSFPIRYKLRGLCFSYGLHGEIAKWNTFKKILSPRLFKEWRDLDLSAYDLVINDFEAISAYRALWDKLPVLACSHQYSFLSVKSPRPAHREVMGEWILRNFAPAERGYGFHFDRYDADIWTPLLAHEIRDTKVDLQREIVVYLPAVSPTHLISVFEKFDTHRFFVFCPTAKSVYKSKNVTALPVGRESFLDHLRRCEGVITSAGFETPSEALFLGKKLMVFPIINQYEQTCNAAALQKMGVTVGSDIQQLPMLLGKWIEQSKVIQLNYPDHTEKLCMDILHSAESMIGVSTPGLNATFG